MNKRLYRSQRNKVLAGVASGLGQYFDVDPIIIRILFLVVALAGGGGILAYIILWIAIPQEPFVPTDFSTEQPYQASNADINNPAQPSPDLPNNSKRNGVVGGIILITLGLLFFIARVVPHINFGDLWPVMLIVVGGIIIFTSLANKNNGPGEIQ